MILDDHIKGCLKNAISSGEGGDESIQELIDVVQRFIKT
jgi:DNA-binding FrmR family transcriptional regulator